MRIRSLLDVLLASPLSLRTDVSLHVPYRRCRSGLPVDIPRRYMPDLIAITPPSVPAPGEPGRLKEAAEKSAHKGALSYWIYCTHAYLGYYTFLS